MFLILTINTQMFLQCCSLSQPKSYSPSTIFNFDRCLNSRTFQNWILIFGQMVTHHFTEILFYCFCVGSSEFELLLMIGPTDAICQEL